MKLNILKPSKTSATGTIPSLRRAISLKMWIPTCTSAGMAQDQTWSLKGQHNRTAALRPAAVF